MTLLLLASYLLKAMSKYVLMCCIALLPFTAFADTKKIDGVLYGNVCRQGNVFSVRFAPIYWAPVGDLCNVLRLDGTIFAVGKITHE